jgi:hypothetical protein
MDAQQTLAGQALYLEMTNLPKNDTVQILLVPMGIIGGTVSSPVMLRRTVNQWSPRAQWQIDKIQTSPVPTVPSGTTATFGTMSDEEAEQLSLEVLAPIRNQLQYLMEKGWTLRDGKLLSMEVSQQDLIDVNGWSSPQGLLRRVLRTRKEAGFPEELFTK